MKFLITGSNGFVGTNLQKFLRAKGHEIVTLDVSNADYCWHCLDKLPKVDCVVHLAGKAHDLKKVSSPESYFEINVGLTRKIFEAMEGKCEKFIYFSSVKALDGDTPYAQSKREAEKYLEEAVRNLSLNTYTSSLQVAILQPAMIHGPGNKGNLNLLWGIAKRGIPWPLAAFENKRSFTSIGNICAIVEGMAERGKNGVFAVADDMPLSTNRVIELIAETCGKKAKLWRVPKSLMRLIAAVGSLIHFPLNLERLGKLTENSLVDNSAIKVALGWDKMPISAEEGLRETLKSFLSAEQESSRLANWNMSEYRANQATHTL